MGKVHPEVRLNRTPITKEWEVVRVSKDGKLITDRWPLRKDDSNLLERTFYGDEDNG